MLSTFDRGFRAGNVRTSEFVSSRRRASSVRERTPSFGRRASGGSDGVLGEEERGRDLAVRPPLGDERRDPALGLRQLAARGRAATDPRQLGAGLLGPERRAEPLEDARALPRASRGRRRAASPAAASRRARAACARAGTDPAVRACSASAALEARKGAVEIAPCGEEQPAAAREDRERPGAVERVGRAPATVARTSSASSSSPTAIERLEQVAELQPLTRLEHEDRREAHTSVRGARAPRSDRRARAR